MAIRTELTLRLENTPGALARLCQALADEKVNVLAMNLESSGVLHVVPDNPVHAAGLLRGRDYVLEERDVLYIQLPNGPGAIGSATRMLSAAGVNIDYAFASAITEHQMTALVDRRWDVGPSFEKAVRVPWAPHPGPLPRGEREKPEHSG